jgi:hypothetical protein
MEYLQTMYGASSDMGWSDSDEPQSWTGMDSLLFVMAASAYGMSLWLSGGLAPLTRVAVKLRGSASVRSNHVRSNHHGYQVQS